ncbi:asparaginase [Flavobacteriaceae bacterium]|jgi:L-asparaginase|nr:asparaginase [Flavobacteriaceae bacterium]
MKKIPNILLIYTGGTIGMIKNSETGALENFNFNDLLESIPELNLLDCNISSKSFSNPIDSSNMKPSNWIEIGTIIEDNYKNYDGFVILHGSDTMSYTASALSFMLENLAKPVIFTGSQLPIGDLRTDAKENLITSIQIASLAENNQPVVQEVGLYFEYKLYRANRTTKINAEHFEAFDSPNYPPLIISGVNLSINYQSLLTAKKNKKLVVHKIFEPNILLVKLFPGINKETINHLFSRPNLKGMIFETYGSGNITNEKWFLKALKIIIDKKIPVVNVTQCAGGSVDMKIYSTNVIYRNIGIISGKDISTEAAVTKLMLMLGQNIPANNFKTKFETSLRGEMK